MPQCRAMISSGFLILRSLRNFMYRRFAKLALEPFRQSFPIVIDNRVCADDAEIADDSAFNHSSHPSKKISLIVSHPMNLLPVAPWPKSA